MEKLGSAAVVLMCFLWINNVSAGTLEFALADVLTIENAQTFDVEVRRIPPFTNPASVTVTSIAGSASETDDYIAVSTVLNWPAGDGDSRSLPVSVVDDALFEGTETFQLVLGSVQGDMLGSATSLAVSIQDHENGQIEFSAATYSFAEDESVAQLTAVRRNGVDGAVSANYALSSGTAGIDTDFIDISGNLNFANGETFKLIFVTLLNDDIAELDEQFSATLSDFAGGATAGDIITATVTVVDQDENFTSALTQINNSDEDITLPDSVDLSQPSLLDSQISLLELLNLNPILGGTELELVQGTDGVSSINLGQERVSMRPVAVRRTPAVTEELIVLNSDASGYFLTRQNYRIDFQPALAAMSDFVTAMADFELSELTVNGSGNIEIQRNQGPPPLLLDENGVVFIDNDYYDRFHFRPNIVLSQVENIAPGVTFIAGSDSIPNSFSISVVSVESSINWQQLLTAAPVDIDELLDELSSFDAVTEIRHLNYSTVELIVAGEPLLLFADTIISRVENFSLSSVGLSAIGDINNDGLEDYLMVYSTGDQQIFFSLPVDI